MFQSIKNIRNYLKGKCNNCSPLCAHCEVEVSEKTAVAITRLLDRRIKQVSPNLAIANELKYQKELILNGAWHNDYDTLNKKENTYVVI